MFVQTIGTSCVVSLFVTLIAVEICVFFHLVEDTQNL